MKKSQVTLKKMKVTLRKKSDTSIPSVEDACMFGDFTENPTYLDGTPVKPDYGEKRKLNDNDYKNMYTKKKIVTYTYLNK